MTKSERLERYTATARFAATLRELKELEGVVSSLFATKEDSGFRCHPFYRALWQDLALAWCQRFPRRKRTVKEETLSAWKAMRRESEAGNFPELDAIGASYQEMAQAFMADLRADQQRLGRSLEEQAQALAVPRASGWVKVGSADESTYSSQGYGASRYARAAAESIADKARANGLTARVDKIEAHRWNETHWRTGASMGERISYRYEVLAQTSAVGAEILARKPEISLREQVRLSWARGTNPRVDMPFLDPDFEQRNGLDHFGGEVNTGRALASA